MSPESGSPGRGGRAVAAALRWAGRLAFAVTLVAWLLVLRPQALGGPAAYVMVAGESMEPTLQPGALAVVLGQPDYRAGDVVAYRIGDDDIAAGNNVIHRIVGGDGKSGYVLRGDQVTWSDPWHPTSSQVIGRVVFVVPGAAPAVVLLRSPLVVGSVAAGIAVYFVLGWRVETRRQEADPRAEEQSGELVEAA